MRFDRRLAYEDGLADVSVGEARGHPDEQA